MATFSTSNTCQMWRISDFSTYVMGKHLKFIHMWRNFRNLHICYVEKLEISPHDIFFLHEYNSWYSWQKWALHHRRCKPFYANITFNIIKPDRLQVSVSIYESAVILFLIVACVAILVSCLGCCGAYKEIKWMLTVVRLIILDYKCYLMWAFPIGNFDD